MYKQSLVSSIGKKLFFLIFIIFNILFFVYIFLPNPQFPKPLPDALQSNEPADTESPLRRAYFTNATRAEVLAHYSKEFKWGYLLNYPPEEAGTIIRDQTRSTFLQEIVHPLRESIYVNGYEPKPDDDKNQINIEGNHYRQKIIVKYVESSLISRIFVFILFNLSIVVFYKEIIYARKN